MIPPAGTEMLRFAPPIVIHAPPSHCIPIVVPFHLYQLQEAPDGPDREMPLLLIVAQPDENVDDVIDTDEMLPAVMLPRFALIAESDDTLMRSAVIVPAAMLPPVI